MGQAFSYSCSYASEAASWISVFSTYWLMYIPQFMSLDTRLKFTATSNILCFSIIILGRKVLILMLGYIRISLHTYTQRGFALILIVCLGILFGFLLWLVILLSLISFQWHSDVKRNWTPDILKPQVVLVIQLAEDSKKYSSY